MSALRRRARRGLVLVAATLALTLGLSLPASADLSDRSPVLSATATTLQVAAPASVSTSGTRCVTSYNYWNGTTTTTLQARVSWPASTTTRGVTGYLVTAYFTDGSSTPVAWVDAPGTSVSGSYDVYYASQNIRVSVTTYTSYGWTAESAKSGAIRC
ncbi:MAG: exported protein of unknown function [Modestobacter sp.]|jgi:hypothetical protein|nr:exported protein of unknown function [Modestobacter sp.]